MLKSILKELINNLCSFNCKGLIVAFLIPHLENNPDIPVISEE